MTRLLDQLHTEVRQILAIHGSTNDQGLGKNRKGDQQRAFDIRADVAVRNFLEKEFSAGIILSEESRDHHFGEADPIYRFIVDPVDGSDNWMRGLPLSSVSVAVLTAEGAISLEHIVAAMVGGLSEATAVVAMRGRGAFRGARRMHSSSTRRITDAFISCELNHFAPSVQLSNLLSRARAVRAFGCASEAITLVASGTIDAHIDVRSRLTPESFLAAAAILQEAGGCVLDAQGGPIGAFNDIRETTTIVAASTQELAREIIDALAEPARDVSEDEPPLAVILAAGEGTRLNGHQANTPKPAVKLLGMSLAERTIAACQKADIRRFLVVLGHEADEVRRHFQEIGLRRRCSVEFVVAKDWEFGNGASALAAANSVGGDPFLLTMSDHLYAPSLIKTVLQTRPREGTVSLAVDRDKTGIFDTSDATKVVLSEGRVIRIGKTLREWDATDTGVFLCTEALFGALERFEPREPLSLSDAISELAAAGRVDAVDVTGEEWIDVDTPAAFAEARRRLLHSLSKERGDGYVSAWLNRPISRSISARLAMTDISPNQLTVISFLICVLGAGLLSGGQYVAGLFGGLFVQIASVVDGCDGEIARLRDRGSSRGAWLDTLLDRVADMAIALGATYAFATTHPGHAAWIIGFLAAFGFVMASYVTKEFEIQHDRPYPDDVLNRLKRRDLRLLLIFLGAVVGRPFEALAVVGLLSYVCIIGIVLKGWRMAGNGESRDLRPDTRGCPGNGRLVMEPAAALKVRGAENTSP